MIEKMNTTNQSDVIERFLRYVKIDTTSSETSGLSPSTDKQKKLGRMLADELRLMGADDVYFDEEYCYVYGTIPANVEGKPVLALIAHMDTSPEASGENVNPKIVENYDGKDILLNTKENTVMSVDDFPELKEYKGQTLIVTDGTTLLGADDKAGVAEIMATAKILIENKNIKHGKLSIVFTPDEEIGEGVDHINLERVGADYAYTVDGGGLGELEYENFNAAYATITVKGVSVHPGDAKGKMKNASLMAMEFNDMLPHNQRPDNTCGYEGFFHLTHMEGQVEQAKLSYIIRDHNMERFVDKKKLMRELVDKMNEKYGNDNASFILDMGDSYYNMKEKIEPDNMFLIEVAKDVMKQNQVEPKVIPIRGGTDGARLSFMGLPCPNICTGGHNYHGRFEYCVVESMEKIVDILVGITSQVFDK